MVAKSGNIVRTRVNSIPSNLIIVDRSTDTGRYAVPLIVRSLVPFVLYLTGGLPFDDGSTEGHPLLRKVLISLR